MDGQSFQVRQVFAWGLERPTTRQRNESLLGHQAGNDIANRSSQIFLREVALRE